jgi:hypothetical protein
MPSELITNIFTPEGFSKLIQILVVLAELVYLLFAFILTREVKLMNTSFKTSAAGLFTLIGYIHLLATILLVIMSLSLL